MDIQTNNEDKEYLKRTGREDKYNATIQKTILKKKREKKRKIC
ncbi:MAG TPA: hypothetical protein VE573_11355 [Nitrososphaeraceae archaeon]|nr:hypothetical protein [Nitrososphaeraceae archaeon]